MHLRIQFNIGIHAETALRNDNDTNDAINIGLETLWNSQKSEKQLLKSYNIYLLVCEN